MATQKTMTTIHNLEEIPAFTDEREEHEFWSTHELSDDLWDRAEPLEPDELPPPRTATTPVVIRLDGAILARAKALAKRRRTALQKLLADLVVTHLDEEERRTG